MISFLNLEYFLALAEELNFNETAKKLNITQQTLSGHIKKLETHFGVKLFNYGPPLEITAAGLLLKAYAQDLSDKRKKMESDMLALRTSKSGILTIGCTFARAQFQLPPVIKEFNSKYPLMRVRIFEGNTPEVEDLLAKRKVDLSIGFVPENLENITSIPLYKDPFLIVIHPSVLNKHFPDRKVQSFFFGDSRTIREIIENCPFLTLSPNTTIGKISRSYLSSQNIRPAHMLELRDVGTMLAMCYEEVGFMFCPKTLVQLCSYPFSKQHIIQPLPHLIPLTIAINMPAGKKLSAPMEAFIKIARESLCISQDDGDE
jgi:DNA-binding transcriptional LysR family regulator